MAASGTNLAGRSGPVVPRPGRKWTGGRRQQSASRRTGHSACECSPSCSRNAPPAVARAQSQLRATSRLASLRGLADRLQALRAGWMSPTAGRPFRSEKPTGPASTFGVAPTVTPFATDRPMSFTVPDRRHRCRRRTSGTATTARRTSAARPTLRRATDEQPWLRHRRHPGQVPPHRHHSEAAWHLVRQGWGPVLPHRERRAPGRPGCAQPRGAPAWSRTSPAPRKTSSSAAAASASRFDLPATEAGARPWWFTPGPGLALGLRERWEGSPSRGRVR